MVALIKKFYIKIVFFENFKNQNLIQIYTNLKKILRGAYPQTPYQT